MYLDSAKSKKSLDSTGSLTLILVLQRARLHCFHTVFPT